MTAAKILKSRPAVILAFCALPAFSLAQVAGVLPDTTPAPTPSAAQDAGLVVKLGYQASLRAGDNLGNTGTANKNSYIFDNMLSLGIKSTTRDTSFSLDTSGILRTSNATGTRQGALDNQTIKLSYSHSSANSKLTLDGSHNSASMIFLDPLLLSDLSSADLIPSNARRNYLAGGLAFETGIGGPLGLQFQARRQAVQYTGTLSPGLYDWAHNQFALDLRAQVGTATQSHLLANEDTYTANDAAQTTHRIDTLRFGVTHDIDAATQVSATLGAGRLTTGGLLATPVQNATVGSLNLNRTLASGAAGLSFDRTLYINGPRATLRAGRNYDFADGAFNISLGATQGTRGGAKAIGGLTLKRTTTSGQIDLSLSRDISQNATVNEELVNRATVTYARPLTKTSSLALSLEYALAQDAGYNTVTAHSWSGARASFSQNLTPDWALTTGYQYVHNNNGTTSAANSNSVFITLGRTFTFRP
jgi:hypothetical protein